jgi:hypothetical protein
MEGNKPEVFSETSHTPPRRFFEPSNSPLLRLSYYYYSTLTSPVLYGTYSQKIETSSQLEGSGTTPGVEGMVYFKQESKIVEMKMFSNY